LVKGMKILSGSGARESCESAESGRKTLSGSGALFVRATPDRERTSTTMATSTQWWTRCTQPRAAHFLRQRERETKSENDAAEETMSATVKLAKQIDEPDKLRNEGESVDANEKNTDGNKGPDEVFDEGEVHKERGGARVQRTRKEGAQSRGACLDDENEAFQEKDDSRPVQGGGKDTEERVMMPHTEKCEKNEVTSVEEGHDVERVIVPQNDETAGMLKQSTDEMSAYLTAPEKKGLDRRTDHQAETQPRSARPPPWRDKHATIEHGRKSKKRCGRNE